MFLTTLATISVISVIFLLIRYRARMAALVAWIIGTVFHSKKKGKDISKNKKSRNKNNYDNREESAIVGQLQKDKVKEIKKSPKSESKRLEDKVVKTSKQKRKKDNLEYKKNKTESKIEIEEILEIKKQISVKEHLSHEHKEKQAKQGSGITKDGQKNSKTVPPVIDNRQIKKSPESKRQTENVRKEKEAVEKSVETKVKLEPKLEANTVKKENINTISEINKKGNKQKTETTTKSERADNCKPDDIGTTTKKFENTNIVNQIQKEPKPKPVTVNVTSQQIKKTGTTIAQNLQTESTTTKLKTESHSQKKVPNEHTNKNSNTHVINTNKIKKGDNHKLDIKTTGEHFPKEEKSTVPEGNLTVGNVRIDEKLKNAPLDVIYQNKNQKKEENKTTGLNVTTQQIPKTVETTQKKPKTTETTQEKVKTTETTQKKVKTTETTQEKVKTTETTQKKVKTAGTIQEKPITTETTQEKVKTAESTQEKPKTTKTTQEKVKTDETTQGTPKTTKITQEKVKTAETTQEKVTTAGTTQEKLRISETTQKKQKIAPFEQNQTKDNKKSIDSQTIQQENKYKQISATSPEPNLKKEIAKIDQASLKTNYNETKDNATRIYITSPNIQNEYRKVVNVDSVPPVIQKEENKGVPSDTANLKHILKENTSENKSFLQNYHKEHKTDVDTDPILSKNENLDKVVISQKVQKEEKIKTEISQSNPVDEKQINYQVENIFSTVGVILQNPEIVNKSNAVNTNIHTKNFKEEETTVVNSSFTSEQINKEVGVIQNTEKEHKNNTVNQEKKFVVTDLVVDSQNIQKQEKGINIPGNTENNFKTESNYQKVITEISKKVEDDIIPQKRQEKGIIIQQGDNLRKEKNITIDSTDIPQNIEKEEKCSIEIIQIPTEDKTVNQKDQGNHVTTNTLVQNIEEEVDVHKTTEDTPVVAETNRPTGIDSPLNNSSLTSEIDSEMPEITQVRVLTLNDREHTNSTVYRIEKQWILQFRLGPSLFGRKVSLYCNYPDEKDGKISEFNRNRYLLLPFKLDPGCSNSDDTALFTEINVKIAGSFHYYFVYENATEPGPQGSGYFLVDPVLSFQDENLPLNCVQCQTVLSKCLGPLSTWENKLSVARESGYNMVHFTPIQELGKSHSAYSLSAQLKLNPSFNDGDKKVSFGDIENFTNKMRNEWKLLSICDIVLNHTANETAWLEEHPESTYNCQNCPYMRPAYLLDAALHQFSINVKKGVYETEGIPTEICAEDHLNAIRYALHTKILPEIKLQEMYICNVSKLVSEFLDLARKSPSTAQIRNPDRKLKLIRDPLFQRLSARVDMELALELYNVYRPDSFDEEARLKRCGEEFKHILDQLNKEVVDQLNDHLNAAVENTIAGIRYFRVQGDGPRIVEISIQNPLTSRYFTDYGNPKSIQEFEEILYGPNSKYLMAHNGWVMNADPMKNFAEVDSNVYIRRELIAWGDSVKLRFGDKPEDSPYLWNHMKEYVELTAKLFDGVRLDNCHSTPIPVAEYLLDCARRVRPDLYVVAELFTNSDHTDNIFVNRLGITSLIREAMSAWDSHEEGRLVHRYGGEPVGAFFQPYFRPLVPSVAHALFLDLTHDNPSPVQKRSVFDLLPSSALVNMACCASGSNRGYDELVNHHIHVVDEKREYTEWTNDESLVKQNAKYVSRKSGIIAAKRALNDLHYKLGKENFSQVYVDQVDSDIVTVTRHCPQTHQSVILVAFTAFNHPNTDAEITQRSIKPLVVEGTLDEIILEASLSHISVSRGGLKFSSPENFVKDNKWINGLSEYEVDIKQHIQLEKSDVFELGHSNNPNVIQLNFKNFKPGSIVAIKVSLKKEVEDSILKLRELLVSFSRKNISELQTIIKHLDLSNLNRALYRCDQEERDDGKGFGAYSIPNFESLVYCGLQGFMSLLSNIRPSNDLGHPMCGNLRDGDWMIDYIVQRLVVHDGTKELGNWMDKHFQYLKKIPRYLVPSYFDVLVTGVYTLLLDQCYSLMSNFINNGSTFVRALSLGSVQLTAAINSASLPTLSPNLAPPRPPVAEVNGKVIQVADTLSAGLPHFSTGYMRSWGRDTFIALRGLFILTGRYQEARYHILGYAACLRHGLIPNLLDGGRNSRFNCRDAVWWWLYCIKCYVEEAPNGIDILSDIVSRIFPSDDSPALEAGVEEQPLYEVIQESLRIHFQGLSFRERNAGRQIDAHMSDNGFNNQIGIHPETGFVFGGNAQNCGTWMDKMGSSDKAGNRGKPATPRDGSAVELIGLSKAVVSWLDKLFEKKQYPYEGVQRASKTGTMISWTFKAWAEKIQRNFERHFWIDINETHDEIRSDLVNKRGIYKDCYGASQEWTDFQLRCNFPIAMVAAPELFDSKHAWLALQKAEKYLLGPLGMKTLDPEDWTYCGDYNNADDSTNFKTAHGLNYHQGPEWVWPIGFFLRARLKFAEDNGELARTVANTKVILSKHFTELQTSVWRGLPELTNSNGTYCQDSCRTQAWSMSCILEVLHDLQRIESKQTSTTN